MVLAWDRLCALCAVSLCTGVLLGENDRDARIVWESRESRKGAGGAKPEGARSQFDKVSFQTSSPSTIFLTSNSQHFTYEHLHDDQGKN